MFPLAFCYECGREYYTVRQEQAGETSARVFAPRELSDMFTDGTSEIAFVYAAADRPWPGEPDEQLDRLPDEWLELHGETERVKSSFRKPPAALRLRVTPLPAGRQIIAPPGPAEHRSHAAQAS